MVAKKARAKRQRRKPRKAVAAVRTRSAAAGQEPLAPDLQHALPKIFVVLRNRTGHDFSEYKLHTVRRRIERRMRVHQIATTREYVELLQHETHEIDLLFQELLITVTQFFRDPEAYSALSHQLRKVIEQESEQVSLRIWVPGCSTGEEPYSIAILATELAERAGKRLQLQIFATDLDARAIDAARVGRYAERIAAHVNPERLKRFFVAEGKSFHVGKPIRDRVVFSVQNVLSDPPFTKLDLLSCRNLLIYLNAGLQQRALSIFHYALEPGAILWLGTSETVTEQSDLFAVTDRKWRLYERRATAP
ncbi:MAG TPA: protein-glutamate O-methyltransferase CheR [Polyangiales bacterium]|nr:protein-glutamate O-methyltransferase CheR [Polyangiales bacterium]